MMLELRTFKALAEEFSSWNIIMYPLDFRMDKEQKKKLVSPNFRQYIIRNVKVENELVILYLAIKEV